MVVHEGRLLLIRRGKEPLYGRWLVPGGTVEWGETLEDAVAREVLEETGVRVRAGEVVAVVSHIDPPGEGASHHFVIVDYLCHWLEGVPRAGSDALAAEWVPLEDLPGRDLPPRAQEVIGEALRRLGLPATLSSDTLRPKR